MLGDCRAQEQDISDITISYQRLEKIIITHLQELQRAMEIAENSNQSQKENVFQSYNIV